ncbi:hypothetical protein B0H10DRAFT_451758 [Mycena sp. CBHHK59/15]|nr:hypothetical protein B0H10DRAFT_451758 [Mycena sp. CBHHK59/15]
MLASYSSALLVLSWCLASGSAAPLSSSATVTVSGTSAASRSPSPSLNSSGNSTSNSTSASLAQSTSLPALLPPTIKQQLNKTLANLSPGAIDRWVTADPISITSLGSGDPTESNADLSRLVDHMFTDDPSKPGRDSWVDTYVDFLIEMGDTNITETQENNLFVNFNNATTAFAKAQVKLVQAYEDASPNNITFVGVNIFNVSRIHPLSLKVIETWGSQGNGSYSKSDFDDYVKLNNTLTDVKAQYLALSQSVQLAFEGNQYKISLNSPPAIFNLSMVVGGQVSSPNAQVAPAWGATIINNSIIVQEAAQQIAASLTKLLGSLPSASPSTVLSHSSSSVSKSSGSTTAHATRATTAPSQRRGLGVVKAVAKNTITTNHSSNSSSPTTGAKASSTSASSNANSTSTSTSSVPLGDVPNTPLKGNLMILSVQPGHWADDLASSVEFAAKQRPDVSEKYFGKDSSGMGPIGRIWTHICILTTDNPDTPGLDSVQVLGKVWDVLPALRHG